jgi:hypothetical protein
MNPIFVSVEQGTDEWHQFRQQGVGSSDIHKLLHSEKFGKTWTDLKREKLKGKGSDLQTEAMKEGKEGEKKVLAILKENNPSLTPACAYKADAKHIRCSFDAICDKEIHEIKSPQAKKLEKVLMKGPDSDYTDQLRWQMLIADAPNGHLQIWDGEVPHAFEMTHDPAWGKKALEVAKEFWDWVNDGEIPGDKYVTVDSPEKAVLMEEYRDLSAKTKLDKERMDKLKELITEGESQDFELYGVKIFQKSNTNYDYGKMIEDYQIAKESYKKISKPFWQIAL